MSKKYRENRMKYSYQQLSRDLGENYTAPELYDGKLPEPSASG